MGRLALSYRRFESSKPHGGVCLGRFSLENSSDGGSATKSRGRVPTLEMKRLMAGHVHSW